MTATRMAAWLIRLFSTVGLSMALSYAFMYLGRWFWTARHNYAAYARCQGISYLFYLVGHVCIAASLISVVVFSIYLAYQGG